MADVSQAPVPYILPPLPDAPGLRLTFLIVMGVGLVVVLVHGWIKRHVVEHGFPPIILMRLQGCLKWGRRHG